jgi:hypothetical protein
MTYRRFVMINRTLLLTAAFGAALLLAGCSQEFDPEIPLPQRVPVGRAVGQAPPDAEGGMYWRSTSFDMTWKYGYTGRLKPDGAYPAEEPVRALREFEDAWDSFEANFAPRPYCLVKVTDPNEVDAVMAEAAKDGGDRNFAFMQWPNTGNKGKMNKYVRRPSVDGEWYEQRFDIWKHEEGKLLIDNEVILERFWPRAFAERDPPVTSNRQFWLDNTATRWDALKQTIAAIKAMREELEESAVYAINLSEGEVSNPLQDIVDKMNKFIDYEPDTDKIDPFPENAVIPPMPLSDPDSVRVDVDDTNRGATILPHGPLYEYYMGALPVQSDFTNESAYYKMYGNN